MKGIKNSPKRQLKKGKKEATTTLQLGKGHFPPFEQNNEGNE